ncbi:DUF1871 domain-containing protein [Paenibacillus sp. WLX1005]|uniref:DUF1871 domain-containing protein n=1 Tax=Paenibacillus sp. WLX1005 TaxID=3243766 RepID=UPI003983DACB
MVVSVKEIIDDWDPIGLLPYAPEDEYEVEIQWIEDYLRNNRNINEDKIACEIFDLFGKRFGDVFTANKATCEQIARKIIQECT